VRNRQLAFLLKKHTETVLTQCPVSFFLLTFFLWYFILWLFSVPFLPVTFLPVTFLLVTFLPGFYFRIAKRLFLNEFIGECGKMHRIVWLAPSVVFCGHSLRLLSINYIAFFIWTSVKEDILLISGNKTGLKKNPKLIDIKSNYLRKSSTIP